MAAVASPTVLNPKTTHYEWLGPPGAAFIVTSLPLVVLGFNAICDATSCSMLDAAAILSRVPDTLRSSLAHLPLAIGIEVAWLVFHCVLYLLPIGKRVKGTVLRNGKALTYNINGLHAFVLCHVLAVLLHFVFRPVLLFGEPFDLSQIADLFAPLAVAALLLSIVGSVILYVASYRSSKVLLALGGNSGSPVYDFWVGRELNPRIGQLDLKFMCELRPGLIGWSLLNWAFVASAYNNGNLTLPLVLVAGFQFWYVLDALIGEAGNLTMMDIVHDGFGFMLCFGDHAWVPFLYSLQAKCLSVVRQSHPVQIRGSAPLLSQLVGQLDLYTGVCIALHVVGYIVFRGANTQKDTFRRDPSDPAVAKLKIMKTSAGKSLIISGYWGICRHPNYVGDWLMTLAWSMLAGGYVIPFFQPVYFAILLIHRQLRDEGQMLEKYGAEDWKRYCSHVPYRLIPYVY